jgi:hypothetical protein
MMQIEADIRDDCLPVMADETQIHQVVMNLCTKILLTGMIEPKLREELLQTGVRSVLIKPVTIGELADGIALSLGREGN